MVGGTMGEPVTPALWVWQQEGVNLACQRLLMFPPRWREGAAPTPIPLLAWDLSAEGAGPGLFRSNQEQLLL